MSGNEQLLRGLGPTPISGRLFVTCGVFTRYFFVAFPWLFRGPLLSRNTVFGPFSWFFCGFFRGFFVPPVLGKIYAYSPWNSLLTQFQEKRTRSEKAILGALGEFQGILGVALGIRNSILGVRNSILGMASHDLSNTKTKILGATPGAIPGTDWNPYERFSLAPREWPRYCRKVYWTKMSKMVQMTILAKMTLFRTSFSHSRDQNGPFWSIWSI